MERYASKLIIYQTTYIRYVGKLCLISASFKMPIEFLIEYYEGHRNKMCSVWISVPYKKDICKSVLNLCEQSQSCSLF